MSSANRLFDLLPAVYRDQDAEQGDVLRTLLRIVTEQVDVVERDVAQLYYDLFVETCHDWMVPYIGDLVGNDPLRDAVRGRADVAKMVFTGGQGHAADACGARARRHRLGGARGGVPGVRRLEPAPRAHPPAGGELRRALDRAQRSRRRDVR